jgi:hypothetical protein
LDDANESDSDTLVESILSLEAVDTGNNISDTLVGSILSLEAVDTGNDISYSTRNEDSYSANSFVNFNRGPAGGTRTFIVSKFNNLNDSSSICSPVEGN